MAMFHWKVDGELHILELHIFDLLYFFRGGGWLLYNSLCIL